MSEHTKEPWKVAHDEGDEYYIEVTSRLSGHVCQLGSGYFSEDDARRIVACVNACAGIDTERLDHKIKETHNLLEKSVFLVEELDDTRKQRDEALALLKRHLADNPKGSEDYCYCELCKDTRDLLARLKS